jgi:hypothetical protein
MDELKLRNGAGERLTKFSYTKPNFLGKHKGASTDVSFTLSIPLGTLFAEQHKFNKRCSSIKIEDDQKDCLAALVRLDEAMANLVASIRKAGKLAFVPAEISDADMKTALMKNTGLSSVHGAEDSHYLNIFLGPDHEKLTSTGERSNIEVHVSHLWITTGGKITYSLSYITSSDPPAKPITYV